MLKLLYVFLASVQLVRSVELGATCASNGDCTATNANSECSSTLCACSATYTDSNGATAGGTCQADLGTACTADSDCTTNGRGKCTSSVCVCAAGYYDSNGAGTAAGNCLGVLGATCTNDAAGNTLCQTTYAVANTECTSGLQCVCKSGYVPSTDLSSCTSGAIRIQASILVFILLAIATLY